jgi:hypothetical protein
VHAISRKRICLASVLGFKPYIAKENCAPGSSEIPILTMTVMTVLKPAVEVVEGPYDLKGLQAPTLSGFLLRCFVWITETPLQSMLHRHVARQSNVPQVSGSHAQRGFAERAHALPDRFGLCIQVLSELQLPEAPLYQPAWPLMEPDYAISYTHLQDDTAAAAKAEAAVQSMGAASLSSGEPTPTFRHVTARDYHEAYQSGTRTYMQCIHDSDRALVRCWWETRLGVSPLCAPAAQATGTWQCCSSLPHNSLHS